MPGPTGLQGATGPQGAMTSTGPPGIWTQMTLAAHNLLPVKDPNTLYVLVG